MSQIEMIWFICMYSFVSIDMGHLQKGNYVRVKLVQELQRFCLMFVPQADSF